MFAQKETDMKEKQADAVFGNRNYGMMLTGLGVLLAGFLGMALDQEPYGFGLLGLTVGPAGVLLGLAIQFFAIFLPPKKKGARP